MSTYSVIDENGQLDTSYLERELRSALEFDIQYKQTDSMKKRACKVAKDYDEFKNMVAASHLKTLTKTEVESLSHVKKGWTKDDVSQEMKEKRNAATAKLLDKEQTESDIKTSMKSTIGAKGSYNKGKSKPNNAFIVERDLRRILDSTEKFEYLKWIGIKKAKSILASSADTDFLEELLKILVANIAYENTADSSNADIVDHSESVTGSPNIRKICAYKWLAALAKFQKFDLAMQFCSGENSATQPTVMAAVQFLQTMYDSAIDTHAADDTHTGVINAPETEEAVEGEAEGSSSSISKGAVVPKKKITQLIDKYSVYLRKS